MSLEAHMVRIWDCDLCGDRYIALPGESLSSLIHWHCTMAHGHHTKDNRGQWRAITVYVGHAPSVALRSEIQ